MKGSILEDLPKVCSSKVGFEAGEFSGWGRWSLGDSEGFGQID